MSAADKVSSHRDAADAADAAASTALQDARLAANRSHRDSLRSVGTTVASLGSAGVSMSGSAADLVMNEMVLSELEGLEILREGDKAAAELERRRVLHERAAVSELIFGAFETGSLLLDRSRPKPEPTTSLGARGSAAPLMSAAGAGSGKSSFVGMPLP